MSKKPWLVPLLALSMAATFTWADLGFAQVQGGQGRGGVASQSPGNPNCPYYSGNQTCPRSGVCNNQARTRKRLRQNVPQAPANPNPQSQNPSPQSGN